MKARKQSSTTYPILFCLVSSVDHVSPVTGASPTVAISKNGNGFAAPSGAVTEVGNGWYKLAGNAVDRDTLGDLIINATAAGADPWDEKISIVAFNPYDSLGLGLHNLDTAVGTRMEQSYFDSVYVIPNNAAIEAIYEEEVSPATKRLTVAKFMGLK